jgi:hypothetical protein
MGLTAFADVMRGRLTYHAEQTDREGCGGDDVLRFHRISPDFFVLICIGIAVACDVPQVAQSVLTAGKSGVLGRFGDGSWSYRQREPVDATVAAATTELGHLRAVAVSAECLAAAGH